MPPLASPSIERPGPSALKCEFLEPLDALESLLSEWSLKAADPSLSNSIVAAAAEVARLIVEVPRSRWPETIAERTVRTIAALRKTRVFEGVVPQVENAALADSRGWGGAIARMLSGPAWRSASTPLLGAVPEPLWGEYSAWLFAAPQRFVFDADADRYATHFLRHVGELARWVERNLGSAAVRAALENYFSQVNLLPLAVSNGSLIRHAELHGRIIAAAGGARRSADRPARPRRDRKLRIAFVGSHPSAIPVCHRSLDANRFEVSAYVFEGMDDQATESEDVAVSAILSLLRSEGTQKCRQLPPTLVQQMAELSELGPDVIIFAEDLALSGSRLSQLASQRIAPLQIAMGPASISTGLSTIDLFALGEAAYTEASSRQFSERLAVLPGSGQLFTDLPESDMPVASKRATLSISPDSCVLMTASRLIEITPAKMTLWAEALRQLPEAVLLIQLLQAGDAPVSAIEALGVEWDARLSAAGVAPQRGLILATPVNSLADLQQSISVADVFLDSSAFAEPDLLHVPLARGVPVVASNGETLRTRLGAAVLRSLGLDELIANNEAQWHEIVAGLALNPNRRADAAGRVRSALEQLPLCRDPLAAAESLGLMLDRAHEDLIALGSGKFRRGKPIFLSAFAAKDPAESLRLGAKALTANDPRAALDRAREVFSAVPGNAEARALAGRAYLAGDEIASAINYLLAAVQVSDDAAVWYDLAVALNRNGQPKEALQALETSLRHDATRADAWVLLVELAKGVGAEDTAREALAALRECAPDDPRLAELTATLVPAS